MLYNLDHALNIDQCVDVSSNIRILPDIRMRVFVGGERKNPLKALREVTGNWFQWYITKRKEAHLSKEKNVVLIHIVDINSFD